MREMRHPWTRPHESCIQGLPVMSDVHRAWQLAFYTLHEQLVTQGIVSVHNHIICLSKLYPSHFPKLDGITLYHRSPPCLRHPYSSSPKKTLIGSQSSPQTLKRSGNELSCFISSSVKLFPSNSKLDSIREAVTLLGITLVPRCNPQSSSTCAVDKPFLSAMLLSVWSFARGESVEPRHE